MLYGFSFLFSVCFSSLLISFSFLFLFYSLVFFPSAAGASLVIENLQVTNKGWKFESVSAEKGGSAAAALRGFTVEREQTEEIIALKGEKEVVNRE